MQNRITAVPIALMVALLLGACSQVAPQRAASEGGSPTPARKQLDAAIFSSPAGLHQELTNPGGITGSVPGVSELYQLLDGSLTYSDDTFTRQPWLADAVPSTDNQLWRVSPDGTMETIWRIKQGTVWQDGVAVTADDVQFTIELYGTSDLGLPPVRGLNLISGVDASDPQTAVLKWRQPFISADRIFDSGPTGAASPMWLLPRHILERPLQENKDGFLGLPYWQGEFVGAGPFKMQEWTAGSSVTLVANDAYVLGRPRIDQITVHFFTNRQAVMAALLAGSVQLPLGRGLYPQDVLQIRDSTQDVKVRLGGPLGLPIPVYPQLMTPEPAIIGNLQFRRALLMALDRQELTDTLNYGLGPIADSWIPPDQPEGEAIDGRIVRYQYDRRAASQMIGDLGYTQGADGSFHGIDGALLSVQVATHTQNSIHEPTTLAVARSWKELGLDVQADVRSGEEAFDLQWRALYPGFFLVSRGLPVDRPDGYFTRKAIPTAENHFGGGNGARYGTAELDGLIQRYVTTIPFDERMSVLGDVVHTQTDQVTMLPLFFQGAAFVVGSNRLKNVLGDQVWNAYQWDLGARE